MIKACLLRLKPINLPPMLMSARRKLGYLAMYTNYVTYITENTLIRLFRLCSHLDEPLLGILIAHSKKKEKIRNQYNQAPNLTQNITLESDKHILKDYIRESQKDSPFPAGDHKDAMEIKKT